MTTIIALACGLLFGLGLIVSGMVDPARVLAFLDLAGAWNPALALVMAGAIPVAAIGFALLRGRAASLLGQPLHLPAKRPVDRRLAIGSLVFGVGWGIAGFCPGPALVALGMGNGKALLFCAAMLVGMGVFEWIVPRVVQAQPR